MKVALKIKNKIGQTPAGRVFTYQDLGISNNEYRAAAKALERLVTKKNIKRISPGLFFKPKKTIFGELRPSEREQLKPYLFNGKKRIAYITGAALFNKMSLTTQVPTDIDLASRVKKPSYKIGNIEVRWIKSYVDITSQNYALLEILDALKDFKIIPDLDKKTVIKRMTAIIAGLKDSKKKCLVKYSLHYPPRARALLGALLESIYMKEQATSLDSFMIRCVASNQICPMAVGKKENLNQLKQSLNPLTTFNISLTQEILPTSKKWFIK